MKTKIAIPHLLVNNKLLADIEKYILDYVGQKERLRFIDKGTTATVWQLQDPTKIVKITKDKSTVRIAKILLNNPSAYIARVYDVGKIRHGVYFTIEEKVEPLTLEERYSWTIFCKVIWSYLGDYSLFKQYQGLSKPGWAEEVRDILSDWIDDGRDIDDWPFNRGESLLARFAKHITKEKLDTLVAWARALRKRGIFFNDFYEGNIMKRGDKYVLIDLGAGEYSKKTAGTIKKAISEILINGRLPADIEEYILDFVGQTKPLKFIDKGTMATVWQLQDPTKVVKVTKDKSTVRIARILLKRPSVYIARVYAVEVIRSGVYFTIEEKAYPLSGSEKRSWTIFSDVLWDELGNLSLGTTRQGIYPEWAKKVRNAFYKWIDAGSKIEDWPFSRKDNERNEIPLSKTIVKHVTKEKLDVLVKWAYALNKRGIFFEDLHGGNIMKRGNRYILIDLGEATVSKKTAGTKVATQTLLVDGRLPEDIEEYILDYIGQTKPLKFLDYGSYATVWTTVHPRRVVKVTSDRSYAHIARKLMKHPPKGVARVYAVSKIEPGVYFTLEERATPLTEEERRSWAHFGYVVTYNLDNLSADEQPQGISTPGWARKVRKVLSDWIAKGKKLEDWPFEREEGYPTLSALKSVTSEKLDLLVEWARELLILGIEFNDLHAGNIMKRGKNFILVDLGTGERSNAY